MSTIPILSYNQRMKPLDKKARIKFWLVAIFTTLFFIYIWGVQGWNDTELFNRTWWFDASGHAIFGFFGALLLIYAIRTYAAKGIFIFSGQKLLMVIVVAGITILGVVWESLELIWDIRLQPNYFNWIAQAQKGSADTTIDLVINTFFALLGVLSYSGYNSIYHKLYPDEAEKSEIEDTIEMIRSVSENISRRRRKKLQNLRPVFKDLFDLLKEKMKIDDLIK